MFRIVYSAQFLDHQTGHAHPESPQRLSAIQSALLAAPWADQLKWREPTAVEVRSPLPLIEQTHEPSYVRAVKMLAEKGGGAVDEDTPVSARSYEVALVTYSYPESKITG
jgi:acetoin utilization deacetylase AcuC-like enzyme